MSRQSAVAVLCILIAFTMTLAGCASTGTREAGPQPSVLSPGGTVAMAKGDSIRLASGGELRFPGIVSDSRCKPDVQCIWAGDAEAAFVHVSNSGGGRRFSLHTTLQPMRIQLNSGSIQLEAVGWEIPPIVTVRLLR